MAVIGAVIWERTRYLERSVGGEGPPGGGGGGGELRYVALAQPEARQVDTPEPPVTPQPQPEPVPEPIKLPEPTIELTPIAITPVAVTLETSGQGSGAGPGSGGSGTTTGSGSGSADGPGSGGEGGYIQPAELRGLITPPDCIRGRFTVVFSIEADGRVSRVDVQPAPADAGCRREFVTRMRQYKFYPAKMQDGRAVASKSTVTVER
jgi:hypothetical protein